MMRRTLILLAGIFAFTTINYAAANAQSTREEFGKCGYYADALQGRKTASGEKYDKNLLTCAHKSLPFGTQLRVTRLDNGKSVIVRVNDRGPFIDGYVTDLSKKAAASIGLLRDGVTKVKIEILESAATSVKPAEYATKTLPPGLETAATATTTKAPSVAAAKVQLVKGQKTAPTATSVAPATYSTSTPSKSLTASPVVEEKAPTVAVSEVYKVELTPVKGQGFGLQLAVLTTTENLFQQIEKLQSTWPGKVVVNHEEAGNSAIFKLIIGPYATRKEATAQQRKAAGKGFKQTFVVAFE